jgi:hypothetical protein
LLAKKARTKCGPFLLDDEAAGLSLLARNTGDCVRPKTAGKAPLFIAL